VDQDRSTLLARRPPSARPGNRVLLYDATHFSLQRTAAIIRAVDAFVGVACAFAHVADVFDAHHQVVRTCGS
jgi:hypothetical protein